MSKDAAARPPPPHLPLLLPPPPPAATTAVDNRIRGLSLEPDGANLDRAKAETENNDAAVPAERDAVTGAAHSGSGGDSDDLPAELRADLMPRHVAIIMDGNSRWAAGRGQPVHAGHEAGVRSLRDAVRLARRWGIRALTVYAFSTENWLRPKLEVNFLMDLFARLLQNEIPNMQKEEVSVKFVGDLTALPGSLQKLIAEAHVNSAGKDGLKLTIAVSYSGRQDIVRACQSLAEQAAAGTLVASNIDEALFERELQTAWLGGLACPDLLIRTSGERRLSNFLLWQAAYTELVFSDTLWPDFGEAAFKAALLEFQGRNRRFGKRAAGEEEKAPRPHT
eukprot:SM000190S04860  [mRNA]  locus=s190:105389:106922:+ [translate_table: standard]